MEFIFIWHEISRDVIFRNLAGFQLFTRIRCRAIETLDFPKVRKHLLRFYIAH